ncbi:hypothetical protein [Niveispirillum fermenti]|uniref:hypothetical protein n=1 Tax=Niveispirillum fermenti TaxID=1233113 RepID=UPI003A8BFC5F
MPKPLFIAFTGADDAALLPGMQDLSARYPIEWGILVDRDRHGVPLFPASEVRAAFLAADGLRLTAHVCGTWAREIVTDPDTAGFDPAGFRRVQVNHGFQGSDAPQVDRTGRFARRHGMRAVLQCGGAFPADAQVDWLYDVSFGTGRRPTHWPPLPASNAPFCGFSGGIGPDNVAGLLAGLEVPAGADFWIDMESGVRRDGRFDLAHCAAVCRAVYG